MGSGSPMGKRARVLRALLAVSILAAATLVVVHVAPRETGPRESGLAAAEERRRPPRHFAHAAPPAPPDTCHAHRHADYQGDMAVVWGMGFNLSDAASCCDACAAHAAVCGAPGAAGKKFHDAAPHPCGDKPHETCNMWVYCEGGGAAVDNRCFSFDIHRHYRGECWLKRQADPTRPTVGDDGEYPAEMRAAPRASWPWAVEEAIWPWEMPRSVHWTSGVLLPSDAAEEVQPQPPVNFVRWCGAHGPCASLPDVSVKGEPQG